MAGTKAGGKKTAHKLLKQDPEFYRKLGKLGGAVGNHHLKGFAVNRKLASEAGRKGGLKSRKKED